MPIDKDSPQVLNALFSFLSNIESAVFWICKPDYTKQIYLPNSYENIWGRSGNIIRETGLDTWRDTLLLDDFQRNYDEFYRRADTPGASAMVYRVIRPDNEYRWIKDTSYTLVDKENNPTIIVGVAEVVSPERWMELYSDPLIIVPKHCILHDCVEILQKNYKLDVNVPPETANKKRRSVTYSFDGKKIELSKKEALCFQYLTQGMTAKETAKAFGISHRTVETHLEKIRIKTQCSNKVILIRKMHLISK